MDDKSELRAALARLLTCFPTDTDMAEAGWDEQEINHACEAHDKARAVFIATYRAPASNHGPEALTTAGLLSALEADTLTGTQRAALAAMIRGREAKPDGEDKP